MESFSIFKDIAIIMASAKLFGILARKLKAPCVVGEIIAGLIIGPSLLGLVHESDFILYMAEIGVILLMFSAGLETNLKQLVKTGPIAFLIALCGVCIPLLGGTLLYMGFYGISSIGSEPFYKAIFMGVILTATSVSITVQVLKELGRLKSKVGVTILSAAIIDDVIGIILLTFVIGFKNPSANPLLMIKDTLLFFLFAIIVGIIFYKIFKWLDDHYPHTRRIPILSMALCFSMAYIAETYFGIADITGAYVAGLVLCSIHDSDYIARKMDINSYMIFGPIFFVSIGLKTDIAKLNLSIITFAIAFVVIGLLTKIIGCGLMAYLCQFKGKDSLKIGVSMMNRGEVALIMSQKGLRAGLLEPVYFTASILLIIISSIATPIALKFLYRNDPVEIEDTPIFSHHQQ